MANKIMKKKGFTLVEGICGLLITSLVIINISLVLTSAKKANKVDFDSSISWYLFIQELESPRHHFEIERVQKRQLFLYSREAHRHYELKGNISLFLTCIQGGGYLPLLDDIKAYSYSFEQLDSQRVLIEVERNNGKKARAIIRFYPVSKY